MQNTIRKNILDTLGRKRYWTLAESGKDTYFTCVLETSQKQPGDVVVKKPKNFAIKQIKTRTFLKRR